MAEAKQRRFGKVFWATTVSAVVVLLGIGGFLFYEFGMSHNPIPADIRAHASFPLYYPAKLPNSWRLDTKSFYTGPTGVVGYVIDGPAGNLNVTIQPEPTTFDFNAFYTKQLSNTFQFLTPLGQGAIGQADGNHLVGSLAGDSWVLISPDTANVSQSVIQDVLSSLRS